MLHCTRVGGLVLFIALTAMLASWRDPSPHNVQFVTVENGVSLEVLDWGGSGRALILLAGGGNTAHVFDDFAPKLTAANHVFGITRRGFGASGFAASADPVKRLRDDVLAVIDALKLDKPVLAGHSIAGAELSAVATSHPERVAGLIYLEAAYPYAFENGRGPTMKDFQQITGPQPPAPAASDLASFHSLREWDARVYGFRMPEVEFRHTWDSDSAGRPVKAREFPGSQALMAIMTTTKKYTNLPVPALVIFAIPHLQETWMQKTGDAAVRDAAADYSTKLDALAARQANALAVAVPAARIVRFRGAHYIFLSNEPDVLREMRTFIAGLR